MTLLFRVLIVAGWLCFAGLGVALAGGDAARTGGESGDGGANICNNTTCLAYCQGFCDAGRLRCKKSGSRERECRARGYRSCMNGCTWEICNMRAGQRPAYQCKRHPDL